ncbi:conserved protein of unknown function [Tenacibaculum sp. 190130A14a]|uniref:Lipocalin-like domain-containing protein n=1 Tax=Tenacibaculum polynesiense TaxID=3137857 RepID=A0ABM9P7D4_9FLAO
MRSLTYILFISLVISCKKKEDTSIIGMWSVEKVAIGNNEMTPNARWMKFNADSSQVSGNGWFQHSLGTWKLTEDNLSFENTNGTQDNYAPFKVEVSENTMQWKRIEDGEEVKVHLKRIENIPASEGNKLLGLWKLESMDVGKGKTSQLDNKSTLFLRWDNTYVKEGTLKGKEYGVYKIHGHKPELQLVNYGDDPKFSFYQFTISQNKLFLKSTDGTEAYTYSRTYQFLQ